MNDTPKTSESAGTPSNNWEATAERLFECSAKLERENTKLRELLKECREEIEGLDHGEGAPGMSIYQRQLVRTLDALLANV